MKLEPAPGPFKPSAPWLAPAASSSEGAHWHGTRPFADQHGEPFDPEVGVTTSNASQGVW